MLLVLLSNIPDQEHDPDGSPGHQSYALVPLSEQPNR